jgi:hypothetical protein
MQLRAQEGRGRGEGSNTIAPITLINTTPGSGAKRFFNKNKKKRIFSCRAAPTATHVATSGAGRELLFWEPGQKNYMSSGGGRDRSSVVWNKPPYIPIPVSKVLIYKLS